MKNIYFDTLLYAQDLNSENQLMGLKYGAAIPGAINDRFWNRRKGGRRCQQT